VASLGDSPAEVAFRGGIVRVSTAGVPAGRHRLRHALHDYQESKNTENVARVLPNTRVLTATVTIAGG
jgi:hypothetical protein